MAFDTSSAKLVGFAPEGADDEPKKPAAKVSAKDFLKQAVGGGVQATGYLVRSAGDAANAAAEGVQNFARGISGNQTPVSARERLSLGKPIISAGESIANAGTGITDSVSDAAKKAMEGSTPEGDIARPSTYSLGKDPSFTGYGLQAANVLGQIAPIAASAVATRGKLLPTATVAGGLGGGAAASQESQRINEMSDADLAKVPAYQRLTQTEKMSPKDARAALAESAGTEAFKSTAPVSAASALTEGLPLTSKFQNALGKVVGKSRLARTAAGVLTEGVGEGVQEAAEQAVEVKGANTATGENRDVGEGSFQQAILGAIGGGAAAGVGGLVHGGHGEHEVAPLAEATHDATAVPDAQQTAQSAQQGDATAEPPTTPTEGLTTPTTHPNPPEPGAAPEESAAGSPAQAQGSAPGDTAAPAPTVFTPANTAMENPDGSVDVAPGVKVHPADGPLSAAVAAGAKTGQFDKPSTMTLPDGALMHAETGEILRPAPHAVDEGGEPLEPKPKKPLALDPGELDQIIMEALARNPMMDGRTTANLARNLGVNFADVSNAKKRVRRALADEKNALSEKGITGAAADSAALGAAGEQETSHEAQTAQEKPGQPVNADAGVNAQGDGGNQGTHGAEASAAGPAAAALAAGGTEAGAAEGAVGQLGRPDDSGHAAGADGQAGERSAAGTGSEQQGAAEKGTAAPAAAAAEQEGAQSAHGDVAKLAKALKKTDRATGPDGATYMVKQNANGEGYHVVRTEEGSSTQHRSPNPAEPWTREQAVSAVSDLVKNGTKEAANGAVSAPEGSAGNDRVGAVVGRDVSAPTERASSAAREEGTAGPAGVASEADGGVGEADRRPTARENEADSGAGALSDKAAYDAIGNSPDARRAVLAAAGARKGLSPRTTFENLTQKEQKAVGEAARAHIADTTPRVGHPKAHLNYDPTEAAAKQAKIDERIAADVAEQEKQNYKPGERVKFTNAVGNEVEGTVAKRTGGVKALADMGATVSARKLARVTEPASAAPSKAEAAPTKPKITTPSKNTIFTDESAAKARALLKSKLSQANAGIDPELLAAGITLAGYHIEKGARTFAAYAKAMIEDLGEGVKPHLAAFYEAVKRYPGMEEHAAEMTPTTEVDAAQKAGKFGEETKEKSNAERPVQRGVAENGSAPALAKAPAEAVQPAEEQRKAGDLFERGSEGDAGAHGSAPAEGKAGPRQRVGRGARGSDHSEPRNVQRVERAAHDAIEHHDVQVQQHGGARARNFVITPDFALGEGGAKGKASGNLAAIKLLKQIESENRSATPEEQAVLARYVGWGGIPQAFAHPTKGVTAGWEGVAKQLEKALTPDEHAAARRSTQDAHYTSREVVTGIYDGLARLGYQGGVTLEPSVGTGNFLGLAPENIRGAQRWHAIELDSITGRIAKQLYPDASIIAGRGFQEVAVPENHFDAAIGNPPFGSQKLHDARNLDLKGFSIHNFFFAKSIKALKPGGVLSMVVSSSMLDKAGGAQRTWLAKHAKLLGAIRLPNTAFKANAGTEVTTDVVFLQKLWPGETATDTSWTEIGAVPDPAGGAPIPLNKYFVQHPEMLLGTMTREGKMRFANEPTLSPIEGADLASQLARAVENLPQNVAATVEPVIETDSRPDASAGPNVAPYAHWVGDDGTIHQRLPDVLDERQDRTLELSARDAQRVSSMIDLRDRLKALMRAEMNDAPRGQIEGMRAQLNTAYDAFKKKFGFVNNNYNANLFREDPDSYRLRAIERDYQRLDKIDAEQRGRPIPAGKSTIEVANKAHILEKRVFYKAPEPKAETAADAAGISLNTYGRLNLPAMSKLLGKTEQQIVAELGDKAFNDPHDGYVTSDEYLSGNVKAKLAEAKAAAERDPAFQRNVLALEDVQPADIAPADIHVALGSPWVPGEHYGAFAREVLGIGDARVSLNRTIQKFDVGGIAAGTERFGTSRFNARKVFERVINHADAAVFDTDPEGRRTVNPEATEAMRGAMDVMQDEFRDWVWKDASRRNVLHRLYNDTHNTDRARPYDGSHLTFPGKVDDSVIALRPHQINGAWRAIQDGRMLADHVVGSGKTFMYIAAAMKMKQMGLAKKPMLAVPNHLVQQWGSDWMKLYPNANILAVTENDFTADRRKLTFSRIATGDWDSVIVAHSQFSRITPPREFEEKYLREKIAEYEEAKTTAEAGGSDRRTIKQIEKMRENLEERLKASNDRLKRDRDTVAFDEMGIDNLIVDEAHEFKNLGFVTNKNRVSGLGTAANGGSQKAEDLFIKSQYLQSLNKGRGLFFATGTPVSNTLAEMFTMQRYMANAEMRGRGIHLFDLWANTFAHESTSFELDSSGRGLKAKTVLSKFLNVPEMMQLYKRFADTITLNDLKEITKKAGGEWPVPNIKGGRAQNTVVQPSAPLLAYIENNIIPRMEAVSGQNGQKPDPRVDNMLKITNDARLAALDVRLRDPLAPDDPSSKPNQMIRDAMELYQKWKDDRGTQLIFCDLSTPATAVSKEKAAYDELVRKAADGDEAATAKLDAMSPDDQLALSAKFSVYDDVKKKLIGLGVPEREVAFIHDANTDLQKKALFDKVNRGDIRFLMGSTAKMGAGTNVQERLVGLHHLDAPWRPSDLEQREGRIVRQGNSLYARDPNGFEVEINRYATERTYDARMWQLIERKAAIVEQIRKGDNMIREVDDVAGEAANAAEMKAAATGNPLIIEQVELQAKVKRLEIQQRAYNNRRWDAENEVASLNANGGPEGRFERANAKAEAATKTLEANPRDPFAVTVGGKTYTEYKAGANAFATSVVTAIGDMERSGGSKTYPVGTYRGAEVTLARQFGGVDVLRVAYNDNPQLGDVGFAMDLVDTETGAVSGIGLLTKVNNVINRIGDLADAAQRQLARDKRRLGELNDLLATPFRGADELKEAQARLKTVTDTLVADSKPKGQPAPQQTGPGIHAADEDIGDLDPRQMKGFAPNLNTDIAKDVYRAIAPVAAAVRNAGVHVYVVANGAQLPSWVAREQRLSRGLFYRGEEGKRPAIIFINASAAGSVLQAKRTLAHELVGHYGMERLLGDKFYDVARDALKLARTDPRLASIKERLARYKARGRDERTLQREALAMLAEADVKSSIMGRVYAAIRSFLRSVGLDLNYSHDEIRTLARQAAREIVSGAIETRKAANLHSNLSAFAADFDLAAGEGIADVPPERVNETIANAARWRVTDIAQAAIDKVTDWKGELLGGLSLHQLADVARSYLPQVSAYDDRVRTMQTRRNQLQESAAGVAKRWADWQRKNREPAAKLAELMHDATLAGVDPAEAFQSGIVHLTDGTKVNLADKAAVSAALKSLNDKANSTADRAVGDAFRNDAARIEQALADEGPRLLAHPKLTAQWNALPEPAKAIYREVRDYYAARADDMLKGLEARIGGLEISDKEKKALADRVRAHFESARVQAPYFPLARFGNYWVSAVDKNGKKTFQMMESRSQQRRVEQAFKAAGQTTTAGMKIDMVRALDGASGQFMGEVVQTLKNNGVADNVADEIYQLYLRTVPDLSTRKHFIHRKGTPGYDNDALRAFAAQMNHSAHQLARLEHGHLLEKTMREIDARVGDLAQQPDTDIADAAARMSNEMKKRHEWVMNPKDSGLVQKLSSANFAFYLGATPAAALVNLTQNFVTTFPALAARHGAINALGHIGRALSQSIRTYGDIQKVLTDPDEKRAFSELSDMGAIDKTLAHDLAGIGDSDTRSYNPGWHRVMTTISHLFHKAEVFNREAAGLAAYRMARESGSDHATAVKYAADTIYETHFDYSNANRARWMQSNAGKVIFAFKQYSQNMTYFLWRNFYQSVKGATPQEKAEARRKLVGSIGVTALLSGAMGLPMMTVAFALANAGHALWGDDDEPFDAETEFHNFLVEHLGEGFGRVAAYGPTQVLTGAAVADRLKLNDMWFRSPDAELEGKDLADYWLEQIAGPIGTTWLINPLTAAKLWGEGNVERAAETVMPKAVKDGMKALRFATQGVNNLQGQPIVKDLSPFETAMQFSGFSPARVAEQYQINNALKGYEKAIETRRQSLMDAYTMALQTRDAEAAQTIYPKILAFDLKYPTFKIDGGMIRRSLQQRAKYSERAVGGIVLSKKLAGPVRGMVDFANEEEDNNDAAQAE